ncbi:sensor histidine kinase [Liquorilactobacillus satsumensis]|uniref:sensor histidine kinase n=1 Tax=Liquorilactobacillus satsumensis TaxID=259059 RepID=UPI0039E8D4A7
MTQTSDWITEYFKAAADAIFILKNNEVVAQNTLAHDLQQELHFDPNYLIELADTSIKQKSNPTDDCFNCTIKNLMHEISIPVTLANNQTHPLDYFLIYQVIDIEQHVFALTLKSRGTIERMDQIAKQQQLINYVNQEHEKERKRISENLHDSIAQEVYSAIMGVRRFSQAKLTATEIKQLAISLEQQLNDTLVEIKRMALDIRPSVLDNFGLLSALKVLAQRTEENSGVVVNVIGNADTQTLNKNIQNTIYRIAQEAINNTLKHAQATEINLLLVLHRNFIVLEAIDNGSGFKVLPVEQFDGHSLGLMNMNERVKAFNGTFTIKSSTGSGTDIIVKIPISTH